MLQMKSIRCRVESTFWPVKSVVVEGGMLALGAPEAWGAGAARTEAQRASWTIAESVNFMVDELGEDGLRKMEKMRAEEA